MSMLDHDQRAVCARAVEFYGRRAQLLKVAEEMIEFAMECIRAANGGELRERNVEAVRRLVQRIAEVPVADQASAMALERADVEIMLYQFDKLLLPSLRPAVLEKINIQVERLERRLNDER